MSDLDLEPGEHILKGAIARSYQPTMPTGAKFAIRFFSDGRLYLTNKRVTWQRRWYSTPLIPVRSFEIPLTDIRGCELVGSGFAMVMAAGGLIIMTDGEKHRLLVAKAQLWPPALWFSKQKTKEWREAIVDAARLRTS